MMNFRERILAAMEHEEPDRVPVMGLIMDPTTVNLILNKKPVNLVKMLKKPILRILIKTFMNKDNNWYLLDDAIPLRYRTRRLEDAAWQYLQAREMVAQEAVRGILTDAKSAGILHPATSIVHPVGRG